jgi:hypothetical protein
VTSLTELREKAERATGPDREIDAAMWAIASGWTLTYLANNIIVADKPGEVQRVIGWIDPGQVSRNASIHRDDIPRVSASIDAALALVERNLPGWVWQLSKIDGVPSRAPLPDCEARVWIPSIRTRNLRVESANGQGATPPLAILSALLRALESQEQDGG